MCMCHECWERESCAVKSVAWPIGFIETVVREMECQVLTGIFLESRVFSFPSFFLLKYFPVSEPENSIKTRAFMNCSVRVSMARQPSRGGTDEGGATPVL